MDRGSVERSRNYSDESDQQSVGDDESQVSQKVKRKGSPKRSWNSNRTPDDIAKSICTGLTNMYRMCRAVSLHQIIHPVTTWFHAFTKLFGDKETWSTGIFFLVFGLLCSFLVEAMAGAPNYNSTVLLTVMAAIAYSKFPISTIRPHIVITLLVTLSIAIDIQYFTEPRKLVTSEAKVLTAMVFISKIVAMADFLSLSSTAERARKYLLRYI